MATTMESSLLASSMGAAVELLARSTFTLFCSMGVMTMKMMSSTSITSTIGVTLILALTLLPSFLTAIDISVRSVGRVSEGQGGYSGAGSTGRNPASGQEIPACKHPGLRPGLYHCSAITDDCSA